MCSGYRVSFLRLKRPRFGVEPPPTTSGAEVEERLELYLYYASLYAWHVRERPFQNLNTRTSVILSRPCVYTSYHGGIYRAQCLAPVIIGLCSKMLGVVRVMLRPRRVKFVYPVNSRPPLKFKYHIILVCLICYEESYVLYWLMLPQRLRRCKISHSACL